jgi:hypothetical protein
MRLIIVIFMLLMISGCATTESLEYYYEQINREDGISRDEAALIAKKWLVESKYEGDFQIFGPVSSRHADFWQITFLYKSLDHYEKVLDVFVDPLSGEVNGNVIRHRSTPAVFSDY